MNTLGALARYFVVFLLTLCVGIAFQLLVSFTVPQVQVASLDGGAFRSWAGFGIRETTVLAGLVATLSVFGVQRSQRPHGKIASNIVLVFVGCSIGSLITLVIAMLTLRLTMPVVSAWAMQIVLQIVAAGLSASWLAVHSARVATLAGLVAILVTPACLLVAYAYPTPLPDETFVVQLSGDHKIHVDCFLPEGEGPHPAVVIFHGVEGATNLTRRAVHLAHGIPSLPTY